MRVIAKPMLRDFWQQHPDAEAPLKAWWKAAGNASWNSIKDVQKTYPQADQVTLKCGLLVTEFNVGGNKYRACGADL